MKYFLSFIFLSVVGFFGVLLYFYEQVRFEADKLLYYNPVLTTQIFDSKGVLLANLFKGEHRLYVHFDDIPARVIEGLVAIEDTAFFEHSGINIDAILRAIAKDIKAGKLVEGASTLTQQLVKTTLLTRRKKIIRKIKEILLSLKVESILTKEEILERYLNQVYFGHGYYGIRTAAKGYFHKDLNQLTLKETAMLVGLPKAPSFYDPTKNLEFILSRANNVIFRMHALGWCNDKELALGLKEVPQVYKESLTLNKAPYVISEVVKKLSPNMTDLKTGGYKINLTIDLKLQNIAKDGLKDSYDAVLARNEKKRGRSKKDLTKLNGALISIESSTGKILAMVGGVDYKKSSFNRVFQSQRQPGSSFKPFLYQTALDLGYSPHSKIADISRTYDYKVNNKRKTWKPRNYEKNFEGLITLKEALTHSRNLATINLVSDIGLNVVHQNIRNFGFDNIPYNLSISLGSFGISPYEFASMYSIFSNYGTKVKPFFINSISDKFNRKIIFETEAEYITSPEQAFLMIDMLKNVVNNGTGRRAKVKGLEIAGKTGTTNKNVDAWFCGFSPTIQTLVWFGNDNNLPIGRYQTGGRVCVPVFRHYYEELLKLYPETKRKFDIPEEVHFVKKSGNIEYFTDTSKLPKEEKHLEIYDELIF